MEQINDIQVSTKKVYKIGAIVAGTIIGGPLVAGYFIAENFKAFNDIARAKKTWVYTILATVVVFVGVYFIPDTVNFPSHIIPLIYTGIVYYLVNHFQGQKINGYINAGGQIHSWWRTISVGLIGLAIMVIVIITIVFFIDTPLAPTNETF